MGTDQMFGNLSYSQTQFQANAVPKLSPDVGSSSFLTSLMYVMGQAWTWAAGLGVTGTETKMSGTAATLPGASQKINYMLGNLRANWKMLPGRFDLGAGWETLSGQDDLNLVRNSLTTLSATGTYYFTTVQSLALTLSNITYNDQLADANSYAQFVVNLQYGLTF
jgi:hypothetical protein